MVRRPSPRWRSLAALLALAAALGAQARSPPVVVVEGAAAVDEEAVGELIGDLMFHADLLSRLDVLCPVRGSAARDWRAVIASLPDPARTPELRALSRRLSDDAARSMVHGSGGCATRQYAQVYAATRAEYESLLLQWARLGA